MAAAAYCSKRATNPVFERAHAFAKGEQNAGLHCSERVSTHPVSLHDGVDPSGSSLAANTVAAKNWLHARLTCRKALEGKKSKKKAGVEMR